MRQYAQRVVVQPLYRLFLAKIARSTVVIVSRRNALLVPGAMTPIAIAGAAIAPAATVAGVVVEVGVETAEIAEIAEIATMIAGNL
jgi:hypothetical protein